MDDNHDSYDDVPYPGGVYQYTDPVRMRTVGMLFGHTAPAIAGGRMLELGCGSGANLIPLALRHPETEFVGIDLSRRQVDEGVHLVRQLGLSNLTIRHADILDVDEGYGTFDYVVAHGVYSWVPDAVQAKILDIARDRMRVGGIAYVSYNTFPGWHMRGAIRDMMLFHAGRYADPRQKVGQARALLDFLANAVRGAKNAYSLMLDAEVELLRDLPDGYLFHDHLAGLNRPLYFHEFMGRARGHGLSYLGESVLSSMVPLHFDAETQETLSNLGGDIVRNEQYLDFVRNRAFRQTLLVHDEVDLSRRLDWSSLTPFYIGSSLPPRAPVTLDDASEAEFGDAKKSLKSDHPLIKAAFSILFDAWPQTLHFDDLLARSRAAIADPPDEEISRRLLGANLLNCHAQFDLDVSCAPSLAQPLGERPCVFPYTRLLIDQQAPNLVNLRHENGRADPLLRQVMALCDGTRDQEELVAALADRVLEGAFTVNRTDGTAVSDPEEVRGAVRGVMAQVLEALAWLSYLV